jgi:hypothetical protein
LKNQSKEKSINSQNQERRVGCGERKTKLTVPTEAILSQKDLPMALMALTNLKSHRELQNTSLLMLILNLRALEEIRIDREDTLILVKGRDMLPLQKNLQEEELAVEVLS